VSGHPDLGREVLGRHQLTSRFDFAFSDELWLDHSFVVPLLYLRPQLDLPVVPIHTNTNAPPLPRPERFLDLGRYLREVVEGWKESARVAVICSGHMAFELGGPRQFMPPSPDPSFDRAALQALSDRDTAGLVELCSYQRMLDAGNLTFQFLNFLVGHGITEGIAPITAATVPSRFGDEPFFAWTGSEQTR
jgi:aromatic ring-opening dioxygenase catalytic subunit (LigB family)